MIDVTFFDIGEGDAILVSWKDDYQEQIGIIDCCKTAQRNPILDEIILRNPKTIKFLIITHFHEDHICGIYEILDHCIINNIVIEYLYHTGQPVFFAAFKKSQVLTTNSKINLNKAFKKITEYVRKFENRSHPGTSSVDIEPIILTNKIRLKFSSPNYHDYDVVADEANEIIHGNFKKKLSLNRIASIIKIYSDNKYILFPSDSELVPQLRAEKYDKDLKKEMVLAEAPHHGSENNFNLPFWTNRNRVSNCPVLFSVGFDINHKLPRKSVVNGFAELNYDIFSTECVFGIKEVFNCNMAASNPKTLSVVSMTMLPSTKQRITLTNNKYNGGKTFHCIL